MAKRSAKQQRDLSALRSVVAWWDNFRNRFPHLIWNPKSGTASSFREFLEAAHTTWFPFERRLLNELGRERQELERQSRAAYNKTGEWLVSLPRILNGPFEANQIPVPLRRVARWYRSDIASDGLADQIARAINEQSWELLDVEFMWRDLDYGFSIPELQETLEALREVDHNVLVSAVTAATEALDAELDTLRTKVKSAAHRPLKDPAVHVLGHPQLPKAGVTEPRGVWNLPSLADVVVTQAIAKVESALRDDVDTALYVALANFLRLAVGHLPDEAKQIQQKQVQNIWACVQCLTCLMRLANPSAIKVNEAWLRSLSWETAFTSFINQFQRSLGVPLEGCNWDASNLYFDYSMSGVLANLEDIQSTDSSKLETLAAAVTIMLDHTATLAHAMLAGTTSRERGSRAGKEAEPEGRLQATHLGKCTIGLGKPFETDRGLIFDLNLSNGSKWQHAPQAPVSVSRVIAAIAEYGEIPLPLPKPLGHMDLTRFAVWFRKWFEVPGDPDPIPLDHSKRVYTPLFRYDRDGQELPMTRTRDLVNLKQAIERRSKLDGK